MLYNVAIVGGTARMRRRGNVEEMFALMVWDCRRGTR